MNPADMRGILFDFGGTLARLNPSKEQILHNFLQKKKVSIEMKTIALAYRVVDFCCKRSTFEQCSRAKRRRFLLDYNTQLLRVLGLALRAPLWTQEIHEWFQKHKQWVLFPDVIPVLERLEREGYLLGIVANWDEQLGDLARRLNIDRFFNIILPSAEALVEKPHPKIFRLVLKQWRIRPRQVFYIGDEYETDVVGARAAGIEPILLDRKNLFAHADCLKYPSLTDIADHMFGGS